MGLNIVSISYTLALYLLWASREARSRLVWLRFQLVPLLHLACFAVQRSAFSVLSRITSSSLEDHDRLTLARFMFMYVMSSAH